MIFDVSQIITNAIPIIIGGAISFVGGYISSRRASRAQIYTAAQAAFIPARVSAYQKFEEAFETWCKEKNRESCAAFYRAGNAVCLVAGDETCRLVLSMLEFVRKFETDGINPDFDSIALVHIDLIKEMRQDLLTYPVPQPVKSYKPLNKSSRR